jgi:hypothetical protein
MVSKQALVDLAALMAGIRATYVLIGGAAMRTYVPRALRDVDILCAEKNIADIVAQGADHNFKVRGAYAPILTHTGGTVVDVVYATTPAELKALRARQEATLKGVPLQVPTLAALLELKRASSVDPGRGKEGRAKDAKDVRALERLVLGEHVQELRGFLERRNVTPRGILGRLGRLSGPRAETRSSFR